MNSGPIHRVITEHLAAHVPPGSFLNHFHFMTNICGATAPWTENHILKALALNKL